MSQVALESLRMTPSFCSATRWLKRANPLAMLWKAMAQTYALLRRSSAARPRGIGTVATRRSSAEPLLQPNHHAVDGAG